MPALRRPGGRLTPVCPQGLSLVLSEGSLRERDGEEKEPPAEEDSRDAETLQGYQWLLRDLPRLPLFHSVSASTALALQQAIHMETDPQTVSAYLVYLSQHTPVEEQGQHSDLALVSLLPPGLRSERPSGRGNPGLAALALGRAGCSARSCRRARGCPRFWGLLCSPSGGSSGTRRLRRAPMRAHGEQGPRGLAPLPGSSLPSGS